LSPFAAEHFLRGTADGSVEFTDHHLTRSEVAAIRERVEALRPDFERLGRQRWFDTVTQRLDSIAQHALEDPVVEPNQGARSPFPEEAVHGYVNRYGGDDRHGILGWVDAEGVLHVEVRVGPGTPSGREMYADMMREVGHLSDTIEDEWSSSGVLSDNLYSFNAGIQDLFLEPDEAARNTHSGRLLAEFGFTEVSFPDHALIGRVGENTEVTVRFSRPETTGAGPSEPHTVRPEPEGGPDKQPQSPLAEPTGATPPNRPDNVGVEPGAGQTDGAVQNRPGTGPESSLVEPGIGEAEATPPSRQDSPGVEPYKGETEATPPHRSDDAGLEPRTGGSGCDTVRPGRCRYRSAHRCGRYGIADPPGADRSRAGSCRDGGVAVAAE